MIMAEIKIFTFLAFIFSLIGGILILVDDFSCTWVGVTICIFVNSDYMSAYNGFIISMGVFFLVSAILSLGLSLKPELINKNTLFPLLSSSGCRD